MREKISESATLLSRFSEARQAHLRLGVYGEMTAVRLLVEIGLDILARNYATDKGEIDIVAREGDVICFVEVKTRRRVGRSRPADAVGNAKRRKLIRTAHAYLREIGRPAITYRFDIVELVIPARVPTQARYWRNAFSEDPGREMSFPLPLGEPS